MHYWQPHFSRQKQTFRLFDLRQRATLNVRFAPVAEIRGRTARSLLQLLNLGPGFTRNGIAGSGQSSQTDGKVNCPETIRPALGGIFSRANDMSERQAKGFEG